MKRKLFAILIAIAVFVAMVLPVSAVSPNLIVNGNFEAGNTGFFTEYSYLNPANTGTWTLGPEYMYTVGTDPNLYHSAWASFGDHTSGTGKMMIVNGTYLNGETKIFWGQNDVAIPAPEAVVTKKTLYAGQDWPIGEVLIKNDVAGKICVKFVLTDADAIVEGWLITQAHVAVAATQADIPQVKGNPVPGQFPVSVNIDPGTAETEWFCVNYNWTAGSTICVAAHAKIEHAQVGHWVTDMHNFCVTSNPTDTDVRTEAGGLQDAVIPVNDPWGSLDTNVNNIVDCPDIASYLWDANKMTSTVADIGGLVEFEQAFTIVGTPTSATLKIAADNAFAYHFNSGLEVDENLAAGWRVQAALDNFDWPSVIIDPNPSGWGTVYTYTDGDLLSSLKEGPNTMYVTGLNADWNTTSWTVNPAAVIYKLCGTSETQRYVIDEEYDSETGWGDGNKFPGKNWATCISYTPTGPVTDTYRFSMWARSAYPDAPGKLQVTINDVVQGTLDLTADTSVWQELWFEFDVPSATSLDIIMRDLRLVAFGDDFCIDDISLVKVTP